MAEKKKKPDERESGTTHPKRSLRDDAEKDLARFPNHTSDLKGQTTEELIHELRVHQIELEMQAEELKKAYLALEESRDKYLDLYDFAPLGYLTLNDKALITDVNITGATLLGVPRQDLVNHGLGQFIAHEDLDNWDQFFMHVRNPGEKQCCTLTLKRGDGSTFPARLEGGRLTGKRDKTTSVRIAISDISDIWDAEEALKESERFLTNIVEQIPDMIFVKDARDLRFVRFNKAGEDLLGYSRAEMLGKNDYDLFPKDEADFFMRNDREVLLTNQLHDNPSEKISTRYKGVRLLHTKKIPIIDENGVPQFLLGISEDITERKRADEALKAFSDGLERLVVDRTAEISDINKKLITEIDIRLDAEKQLTKSVGEKEVLLREVHHRVKNNLQIIISLLNLQSRYMSDDITISAFRESQNRIKAMALVHEKLYQSTDVSSINLDNYIRFLGENLFKFFGMKGKGITFTINIKDIALAIDTAIPVGLMINELISNSLKYAFPEGRKGEISIAIHRQNHTLTILFKDNGVGIPDDFDWRNAKSLGLRLVISLVEQLQGTIELDRTAGTAFNIVVKEKP